MQEALNKLPTRHILIILGYFSIAMLIVGHPPNHLLNQFIGSSSGDVYEMARNAWWFTYAIQHGEPLFQQTLLGYPDGIDGSVLMTLPLQYFPFWGLAFFLPLHVAYNLTVLFWMALNGWAMYWLMRYALNDEEHLSALLAGLVYMAFPLFQGHLAEGHGGLMVAWPAPLYIWSMLRLIGAKTQVRRWLLASILFFYLSTTGHILQAIYVLMPITGSFILQRLYRRDWVGLFRISAVAVLSSGLLVMVLYPAIQSAVSESAYADTHGYVRYSLDGLAIGTPSFFHPIFSSLDYSKSVLGTNLAEGLAYIGVVVGILVLIGVIRERHARWWFILGIITWILALGPLLKILDQPVTIMIESYESYFVLPFALLQEIPGFSLARSPARFTFTVAIAIAVMSGFGASWVLSQRRTESRKWRVVLAGVLACLIVLEYQSFWPQPLADAEITHAAYDLRDVEGIRAIFNIPVQNELVAKDALYLQTAHQYPLIAGQITRRTPVNPAMLMILQETLEPALLKEAGADVVFFHRSRAQANDTFEEIWVRARGQLHNQVIFEDDKLMMYLVPEAPESVNHLVTLEAAGSTEDFVDYHFFAPRAGWVDLQASLSAEERTIGLFMNGERIHHWYISGENRVIAPVYIPERGYYTVQFALAPICPDHDHEALQCKGVNYDMQAEFSPTDTQISASFDEGIRLKNAFIENSDSVTVRLWWAFDEPRNAQDRRFVHIVDEQGSLVAQQDALPADFAAGESWTEIITFEHDGLAAGTYQAYVGWYNLDTQSNYISNGQSAILIGSFEIIE